MTEQHRKENDYTISSIITHTDEDSHKSKSSLTRTFNFLSAQVTTIARDCLYQGRGWDAGGSASVTTQIFVQNFSDIESYKEIEFMHQKLKDLGGAPPPLSEILPRADHKKSLSGPGRP